MQCYVRIVFSCGKLLEQQSLFSWKGIKFSKVALWLPKLQSNKKNQKNCHTCNLLNLRKISNDLAFAYEKVYTVRSQNVQLGKRKLDTCYRHPWHWHPSWDSPPEWSCFPNCNVLTCSRADVMYYYTLKPVSCGQQMVLITCFNFFNTWNICCNFSMVSI